jgi:hypothetical protein
MASCHSRPWNPISIYRSLFWWLLGLQHSRSINLQQYCPATSLLYAGGWFVHFVCLEFQHVFPLNRPISTEYVAFLHWQCYPTVGLICRPMVSRVYQRVNSVTSDSHSESSLTGSARRLAAFSIFSSQRLAEISNLYLSIHYRYALGA